MSTITTLPTPTRQYEATLAAYGLAPNGETDTAYWYKGGTYPDETAIVVKKHKPDWYSPADCNSRGRDESSLHNYLQHWRDTAAYRDAQREKARQKL